MVIVKSKLIKQLKSSYPNFLTRDLDKLTNIILKEIKNTKANQQDLNDLLIKFTILHGQLMDVINSAKSPEGHKGESISAVEKKEIFSAFEALEHKILKIKTTIENS